MDSSASTLILCPPLNLKTQSKDGVNLVFDSTCLLQKQQSLPTEFLWPHEDLPSGGQDEVKDPPIDLTGFFHGDEAATTFAAARIRTACLKHGFFQVVNHGVNRNLIRAAHHHMDAFFNLPLAKKLSVKRKPGELAGYSGAHADRFSTRLPWKETYSFVYNHANNPTNRDVVSYFKSVLGNEFEVAGCVYQKYCEEMERLALVIFELLAISLGVDRGQYRKFFEDGSSIMRGNNYPPCKEAGLTLGTGPHSDPNSLTILHQDNVGGLEIFSDNKWQSIKPCPDAFVVNIGDTFMALCNGRYKSCVHRAVVNKLRVRRSLVFFVNPKEDKVVTPPLDLVLTTHQRLYPDFTWTDLRDFTQNHYRADTATLQNFVNWLSNT
ncbi:hypothetical protein ACS0TY_029696 [Phlomoides rotata]